MIRKILQLCAIVTLIGFISGCYPKDDLTIENTDLVITNYNPGYNFSSINTYFMPDSIYHITDDSAEPDRTWDEFVIGEIAKNFDALGYTRVPVYDNTNPPNVVVVVTVNSSSTADIFSFPWFEGWYDGWEFNGYVWGYPWWDEYTVIADHAIGTIYWQMFDPAKIDYQLQTIFIEWIAIINGIVDASTSNSRISKGINQAFKQSNYLIPNY